MSSFQFPANPSDGDIVVRGNLQAFYNAATNTWRVSEVPTAPGIPGPPGPPGPIGPPGQGITVSGSVDTEANLPAPNAHQYEFWVVDDTNTLYWSTGLDWTDLGSPIQGPQGDPGEDGEDGTPGQNGRGWYDTSVDTSNGEYKVTFLSNDGLTFTTDNLKGPKGDDGEDGEDGNDGQDFDGNLPLATTSSPGIVQIGTGIDVDTAGVIKVDLDTIDLGTQSISYRPIYTTFGDRKFSYNDLYDKQDLSEGTVWTEQWTEIDMPDTANGAVLTWFQNSTAVGNPNKTPPAGGLVNTFMGMFQVWLEIEDATFVTSNMGMNHLHHIAAYSQAAAGTPDATTKRVSGILTTKTNEIFIPATSDTIKVRRVIKRIRGAFMNVEFGVGRLSIQPYRANQLNPFTPFVGEPQIGDSEYIEGLTEDEQRQAEGDMLRDRIRQSILQAQTIQSLPQLTDVEKQDLQQTVQDLLNVYSLGGSYLDLDILVDGYVDKINSYLTGKFIFEP